MMMFQRIFLICIVSVMSIRRTTQQQTQKTRNTQHTEWEHSINLSTWYTPFDICMLSNKTSTPIEGIMQGCESKHVLAAPNVPLKPNRCRAGNSWPSKGGFCSSVDIPYSSRGSLRMSLKEYDDPTQKPLRSFFSSMAEEKGALLLIGDSVMQQYYSAIACELEREGVWSDPSLFKDTDALKYVRVGNSSHSVPIRFQPIYHFVNGRHDRVANASMYHLKKAIDNFLEKHDSLMVFMNVGLHYVSNPIAHFSRKDYTQQITEAFQYLNNVVLDNKGKKNIRVIWRESSAQHFPTYNGYWPGLKYAKEMDVKCVAVQNTTEDADWRNKDANAIIRENKFAISIAPFYDLTLPLYSMHVNGHLRDCTHLCWSPMLYQSLFHYMDNAMKK